jgi:hypothetical protein
MTRILGEVCVCLLAGALAIGCGSSREVEVTGEVSAASGASVGGPIRLELYDVEAGDDGDELTLVHSTTLDQLGSFSETADFSGDKIVIRAIEDRDGNTACSAGELWGEAAVEIDGDDKAGPAAITLAGAACPSAE